MYRENVFICTTCLRKGRPRRNPRSRCACPDTRKNASAARGFTARVQINVTNAGKMLPEPELSGLPSRGLLEILVGAPTPSSGLSCLNSTKPISEQPGGRCSNSRRGHVEPCFFGNEEPGARAGCRADRAFRRVMIRVILPHDVDPPLTADDVEAIAFGVEENIVRV